MNNLYSAGGWNEEYSLTYLTISLKIPLVSIYFHV